MYSIVLSRPQSFDKMILYVQQMQYHAKEFLSRIQNAMKQAIWICVFSATKKAGQKTDQDGIKNFFRTTNDDCPVKSNRMAKWSCS